MAKASDPRLAEIAKKRPSSAPKPGETADIPKIILNERKETASSFPASLTASVYSCESATSGVSGNPRDVDKKEIGGSNTATRHTGHVGGPHMSVRSSSDIGLPATSMPNLAVSLVPGGDMSTSENYLEVFCSPRTFRRSVDFDINSKEHTRAHFELVDAMDSSSNCLKVLTSSSRVGSALSLNSECTARSIGLLSNDSDSDNDLSLTESEKLSLKPSQLRRYMSYPEDGVPHDICARPSQSMSNLKTTDNADVQTEHGSDVVLSVPDTPEVNPDKSDSITHAECKSESASSACVSDGPPSSPCDLRLQEKKMLAHTKDISRDRSRSGSARPSHMLSYRCDTHDSARDCRIRQWLQDMDSQD